MKSKDFMFKGKNFEAVLGKNQEEERYTVYLMKEDGKRMRNGDIDPHAAHPDRYVISYASLEKDDKRAITKLHEAATRLINKAEPYYAKQSQETLWDYYERYQKKFFLEKNKEWSAITKKQYQSIFEKHLKKIYQKTVVPFSVERNLIFYKNLEKLVQENQKSSSLKNKLIYLHSLFCKYLNDKNVYLGQTPVLNYEKPNRKEQLSSRFSAVRSLDEEKRLDFLRMQLEEIKKNTKESPLALGLLLMLLGGFRTGEALGICYEDLNLKEKCLYISRQHDGRRLKTGNAYRWVPIDSFLYEAILIRKKQVEEKKNGMVIGIIPLVSDLKDCSTMGKNLLTDYATKEFKTLGVSNDLLKYYRNLILDISVGTIRTEKDVYAYLLRRDYITRLYQMELSYPMIEYLSAHERQNKKWKPTMEDLQQARKQMDEFWEKQEKKYGRNHI